MKRFAMTCAAVAASWVCLGSAVAADVATKDIVLDRLSPMAATPAVGDAMAVSVLLEGPDGSLTPRSTDTLFRTGDRFRVKVLASRTAKLSLYNTTPRGVRTPTPIWEGTVKPGEETVTPRLALAGDSGIDLLHVVLEPSAPPQGLLAWLDNWLRSTKDGSQNSAQSKDIRLDVQNTPSATYLVNSAAQGLSTTIRIAHR